MTTFHGIILSTVPGGVRLKLTARADLVQDRLRLPRNSADVAVVETSSREMARRLRRVLERVFCPAGSGGILPRTSVDDAITRCRRMGFNCHQAGEKAKPEAIVAWRRPIVERRRVPDPSMSRAEMLHQLDQHPDARWIGYQRSDVNLTELIGGLARVRRRTEPQVKAAAEFRNLYERGQLGGSKAIDLSAVRVDTSLDASNPTSFIGAEARARYVQARERLGKLASVAERIIISEQSVVETAKWLGLGTGGAARDRVTKWLLEATDKLAVEFGFVAKRTSSGMTGWTDGTGQTFSSNGENAVISTRAK